MICSLPPPLTPDELSAAIDGHATADVLDHLAGCAHCRARLAEARAIEQRLSGQLHRWDCPRSQVLVDYHLGLLDEDAGVGAHVAGCASCRDELAELTTFLNKPAALAPVTRPRPIESPARPSLWEILGQLLPQTPGLAMRGENKPPLIAQAGEIVIVLDVQAAGEARYSVDGQLTAPEQEQWTGALVRLRQPGEAGLAANVDEAGSFRFEAVSAGRMELRVTPPAGRAIVVPDVDIGGRARES